MAKRIILDVDTGIDDAQAIILALKSPELKVEALTTVAGNTTVENATRNTLKILEIVGEHEGIKIDDVPVASGMHRFLVREYPEEFLKKEFGGKAVHGLDGLGGIFDSGYLEPPELEAVEHHAVDLIIEKVMNNPGEIMLVPTGPLTNIAMAILKEPRVAKNVKEIILMGGAFEVTGYGYGNVTPVSEFNEWCDPEAAKIVYECGAKVTAVGLDVTTHSSALITEEHLKELRPENPIEDLVIKLNKYWMELEIMNKTAIHDPLAVAVAIDSSFVKTKSYYVYVVTMVSDDDPTRGQTIADMRPYREIRGAKEPNVNVCTNVDGERFLSFFIGRVKK